MQLVCLVKQLLAVDRGNLPADSQDFTQRMQLPLSEAAVLWQGRQKIALRVLFLLECLQGWLTPDAPNTHIMPSSHAVHKGSGLLLTIHIFTTLRECLAGKGLAPAHTVLLFAKPWYSTSRGRKPYTNASPSGQA